MSGRIWLSLLLTLVLGSALTVIYVKHESRVLFAELRSIQKQQDQQVIHWGRLQLQNTRWRPTATWNRGRVMT
jgi:cell division protein FtsL